MYNGLHGQFERATERPKDCKATHEYFKHGNQKRTESVILVAHEQQALRTKVIASNVYQTTDDSHL